MRISAWTLFFGLVLAGVVPGTSPAQTAPPGQAFRVTLLGTGTPNPNVERFGPSTLVEVGNQKLLFDVGRGATIRLTQLGVPLRDVTAVFVTHLHSDHVNGLSDLWLTGWLPAAFGRRTTPFRIFGPFGTREMMSYLEKAHQADIRIRMADENLPASGIAVDVTDVSEGVVYEREGVRVTVFDVDHGETIKPAFGYRVDYRGRSVVMSGDTRVSTNLIKYAKGVTVIVHEVMAASADALARSAAIRTIMAHHTSPEEAGRVFTEVAPRLAVFSHIVLSGDSETPPPTPSELIRRTQTAYTGALEVASDLMSVEVDDIPRVIRRDLAPR
jgi:ribonuclease Z